MRTFTTGATRDSEDGKLDYEGFLSPLVLRRFAEYMHTHRLQTDGALRASDNWQKGIPCDAYMKSGWRHFMAWWSQHRGMEAASDEDIETALCALMFNVQGYLHERLKRSANRPEEVGPGLYRSTESHSIFQKPERDAPTIKSSATPSSPPASPAGSAGT